MSEPVLRISGARKQFAERKALQDVSLSVVPGSIVALLGPNGAGKTTLMRAACGRLRLESGSVQVAGGNPATDSVSRRALGIVPQSIALYPQLTATENLDVFARLMGVRHRDLKSTVANGLARAGLADRGNDLLVNLSGGMRRRLNIVAGTLHQPQLLLLDEPTVGVDLNARESIHALLDELRDSGMGMLLSTHDFEQAASIADYVAFMLDGRVIAEGRVDALIHQVFGGAKELQVNFSESADHTGDKLLREMGLLPSRDGRCWSGPLQGGYADLPQIESRLERAGMRAAELRLRDPGLNGVFLHLTGRSAVDAEVAGDVAGERA